MSKRIFCTRPASLDWLACMVTGTVAALGYQLVATDTYTWTTFAESFGLLLLGGVLGWIQTRYIIYQHVLRRSSGNLCLPNEAPFR